MPHILIIDDNPDDRLLVRRELEREFSSNLQVTEIGDELQLEHALAINNFDLVITHYQLCWDKGLRVLLSIKSHYPNCPVIMFASTGECGVESQLGQGSKFWIKFKISI